MTTFPLRRSVVRSLPVLLLFQLFLIRHLHAAPVAARCVGVTDGDTVTLLADGRQEKVRLYGIDAPEKRQAYGKRARQYASLLVFGRQVLLDRTDTDRYGRTVGWIYLGHGRSLNAELLRAGLAWHYAAYSRDASLARLEREARLARRGLWMDPFPVPPWEFRKKRVKNRRSVGSVQVRPTHSSLPPGNEMSLKVVL